MENGLRTHRPDLENFIFGSEANADAAKAWMAGVPDGTTTRAMLLTGAPGLGKTTLAKAMAAHLGTHERDLLEINCANLRTLEAAREIVEGVYFSPTRGKFRGLLLDEVHQMVDNAQQVFLTPLEKLPARMIVMAASSDPDKLNKAFRSRFFEIPIKPYDEEKIVDILSQLPVKLKPSTMVQIARVAEGNPRAAIALAEKMPPNAEPKDVPRTDVQVTVTAFLKAMFNWDHESLYQIACLVKNEDREKFVRNVSKCIEILWAELRGFKPQGCSAADRRDLLALMPTADQATASGKPAWPMLLPGIYAKLQTIETNPYKGGESLKSFVMEQTCVTK